MAETWQEKRKQKLINKFGSEQAYKEYFREMQKKSRTTYHGTGGTQKLPKERRIEIARNAGNARWKKKNEKAN